MLLIDTDVLSALRKRNRHPVIAHWVQQQRSADLYLSVVSVGEIERDIERQQQSCNEVPGARLPRRTHPEVSGVVPRAACRRSLGSGFTARVAWPPTLATMMHRPCDASCCFQTDRFGQRVP